MEVRGKLHVRPLYPHGKSAKYPLDSKIVIIVDIDSAEIRTKDLQNTKQKC
jgi:hypothetical protein